MAIPATVRDVERVEDDEVRLQFVTLAVAGSEFPARDTRELVDPSWEGSERDVVVMAFFPDVAPADWDEDGPGVAVEGDRVAFTGRVTDVQAGEEGFVGTLDVGSGTVRFDPGTAPDVRPGDDVRVTSGTIHVVAVEE